ncbi:CPBP family intramembrane glutamic endopeptidase [Pseudobacteriovorax antillogorgiicola]|uniref:CAAX protease self-immunity n=1 Tax=Pseudobacteriovorax antillogorgiicola TaxID=1513793 RepID=A0A1Y6B2P6_9BACT|nr:CPBP family intramembrane glutamic endopeptidase [Pseudobacteriovorax antillogorgiicola]TCS59429.1 CAAX prenyl protease-like protein [Pseudobacteriovorax antillogorgiicola]SME88348.1 CAAX protease self-immunity [Pseudobacteriovorax antillogorgiicola]
MLSLLKSRPALATLATATALAGLLTHRVLQEDIPVSTVPAGMGVFFCLLLWYLLLGLKPIQDAISSWLKKQPRHLFLPSLLYTVGYIIYGLGTDSGIGDWWIILLYGLLPSAVMSTCKARPQKIIWQDIVLILLFWIPVDARLVQPLWPWPKGVGGNAFTITLAVPLLAFLMSCQRQLSGVGYYWTVSRSELIEGLKNFVLFIIVAIPFGLQTQFISWAGWSLSPEMLFTFLITFLWIAVPEELLFRGVIQNLLQKHWQSKTLGLIVASVIFGLSHLNNGPEPDWRYFVLSTIAGIFYGLTFNKSRSLVAAALVHTLVDTVWIHYFRG